ncbi:MAG: MATE family efflux transporter [Anaerococcus sp.]|nr:MATE family efflux transporter [Anaerococcus sp.]
MKKTLLKSYLRFLLPTLLTMVMYATYTMVDGIFVGQGLGSRGISAVNIAIPFVTLTFALSILISIGSLNLITYQLGRGDKKKADELFSLGLSLALGLGIFISAISLFFLDELISLLGAKRQIHDLVKDYLSVILIFTPFYILAYFFEIMVKADGKPIIASIFMVISALTNIILDYLFIFRLGFGLRGAALATGMSQFLPTLAYLGYFRSKLARLKFRRFTPKAHMVKSILTYGLPASLSELSSGFVTLLFNKAIGFYYGIDGLASFSVISYTMVFVVNIMIAITQASQPLISFNFGKKSYERVLELRKYMIVSAGLISLGLFALIYTNPKLIIDLFIGDYDTNFLDFAQRNLRVFSISFLIMGFNMVNSGYMSAVKRPRYDFYITILRGYILISGLILILPRVFERSMIWHSLSISELISLFISFIFIRKAESEIRKLNKLKKKKKKSYS